MGAAFSRWENHTKSSWPLRVYKAHIEELMKMFIASQTSHAYVHKTLTKENAKADESAGKHFRILLKDIKGVNHIENVAEWRSNYDALYNWNNLNTLVALCGIFETYIVTVVSLALNSDFALMDSHNSVPHSVDGIAKVKHGLTEHDKKAIMKKVTSCVKGTWETRIDGYKSIFGQVPDEFNMYFDILEKSRKTRNDIAHSFGRDIKDSRDIGSIEPLPIHKVTEQFVITLNRVMWECAQAVDKQLLANHIGEYQLLYFYHEHYNEISKNADISMRAKRFKKEVGKFKDLKISENFSKDLIRYYEAIE